ncbi:hypothetical protein FFI87_030865 [Burkholderia sp. KBS0801]|nr:hypothetical protein FFI87_030865 [Burkholderia sp. KBS0801]
MHAAGGRGSTTGAPHGTSRIAIEPVARLSPPIMVRDRVRCLYRRATVIPRRARRGVRDTAAARVRYVRSRVRARTAPVITAMPNRMTATISMMCCDTCSVINPHATPPMKMIHPTR